MNIEGVGIDFGTYNTKIAVFKKGVARIFQLKHVADSGGAIASFVWLSGKKTEIGRKAKRKWLKDNENVWFRFKLDMFKGEKYEEKSVVFLNALRKEIEKKIPVSQIPVCFTHPNGWTSVELEKYRDVIENSGFNLSSKAKFFCREPYAAGNYVLNLYQKRYGHYLVVDVGAGTFDVSLIEARDGSIEVKKEMDAYQELAGSHIDEMIGSYLKSRKVCYENIGDRKFLSKIERAKIEINKGKDFYEIENKEINRNLIREACKEFVNNSLSLLENIKKQVLNQDISLAGIIPAGGSGNFFLVKEALNRVFPGVELLESKSFLNKSDDSIVLGAAFEASGKRKVSECTKHPICISFRTGFFNNTANTKYEILQTGEKIFIEVFPKNQRLPVRVSLDRLSEDISLSYSTYPSIHFFILKSSLGVIKEKNEPFDNSVLHKRSWKAGGSDLEKLKSFSSGRISFDIVEDENRIVNIILKGWNNNKWEKVNSYEIGKLEREI